MVPVYKCQVHALNTRPAGKKGTATADRAVVAVCWPGDFAKLGTALYRHVGKSTAFGIDVLVFWVFVMQTLVGRCSVTKKNELAKTLYSYLCVNPKKIGNAIMKSILLTDRIKVGNN